jgi:glyoxylase-like metal-dependent hydrolase (beta-lactamase superfamily II)
MSVLKIGENLFLIDVETGGFRKLIASYVLRGRKTAIVETGPTSSIPNLLSGLRELNVELEDVTYVAVSHIHIDHGGGVGTLLKYLPKAQVIVHQRGAPHLANPEKLWIKSKEVLRGVAEIYGAPEPVAEDRIIVAIDGMSFDIGDNVGLKVVETPGHSSHHLSYWEPLSRGIFTGDAAGIYLNEFDVIVPTTPPPFRLDLALASLDKLSRFEPNFLYYSHFGKASDALVKLKTYAQQLKLWANLARIGVRKKEGIESISGRIIRSDKNIQNAAVYIKTHPILKQTAVKNSIQGLVDFMKKSDSN